MVPLRHSADLLCRFPALLCDIWGVVHNGMKLFPDAMDALKTYRASGGVVVLISNSPRPSPGVCDQLRDLGAGNEIYDAVATSGDAIWTLLKAQPGMRVYHLGPDRDRPLIDGLDIELVDLDAAASVLCTGLFDDETETPDDYEGLLGKMADRGLPMYCANPDRVVHRGDRLIHCAGALAAGYADRGGRVLMAGKPHAPIYELAFDHLETRMGRRPGRREVLAIGDGVPTDIAGAAAAGLDTLFIAGGIHGLEFGEAAETPDLQALSRFVDGMQREIPALRLAGIQTRLRW